MKLLLPIAIFLMMVSIGTSFRLSEMRTSLRAMGWLAWSTLLLAVFILPPALALGLARVLRLSLSETGGLFLLGVAPGAPLLTRNIARRGFDAQVAAIYQVAVALLTPIMIPVLVAGAAKLYDRDIWIPPLTLLAEVAEKQFLPLIIGMALMYWAPGLSAKMRPIFNAVGNTILFGFIAIVLFKERAELSHINLRLIAATALLAAGSIALVYLLQTDAIRKRTLAICNANRYVGLALLLSGKYFHSKSPLPTIACYAVIAPLIMWLYSKRFGIQPGRTS